MRKTGPTNIVVRKTIRELRKLANTYNARIWDAVADELEKPRRQRRAVNISRINRHTKDGDIVVVPGKVLGAGHIDHPVTVAALAFSKTAIEKILNAGGKAVYLLDLAKENPKGTNIKIIG